MGFIFGLIIGIVVSALTAIVRGFRRRKPIGVLRIDSSDPDGPYMFLELSEDPRVLMSKKRIALDVKTDSYISQK